MRINELSGEKSSHLAPHFLNRKYKIIKQLGSGSFGVIYKGQHIRTNEYVAIKVEPIQNGLKLLKNESMMYSYLQGCNGIPNIKWFGKDTINYYMVISLLGPSLKEFRHQIPYFSLRLVLKIGLKIITLLKTIHYKGLVHRDVKPENFLFGINEINQLYLIDFGFCKSYLINGYHIQMRETHNLIGSINYASVYSHIKMELSRRDDLESAIYILLYLWNGILPWNNDVDKDIIIQKKEDIVYNTQYPSILIDTLKYLRKTKFEEEPNYSYIMSTFERIIKSL